MNIWHRLGLFAVVLPLIAVWSCTSNGDVANAKTLKIELISISQDAPDWSENDPEPYKLATQKQFEEIRNSPCSYLKASEELLSTSQLTPKQQLILPYVLMKLPLRGYLDWMSFSLGIYKKGLVSADFLDVVVFPDPDQRRDVYFASDEKAITGFYSAFPNEVSGIASNKDDWSAMSLKVANGQRGRELIPYMKGYGIETPVIDMKSSCK